MNCIRCGNPAIPHYVFCRKCKDFEDERIKEIMRAYQLEIARRMKVRKDYVDEIMRD